MKKSVLAVALVLGVGLVVTCCFDKKVEAIKDAAKDAVVDKAVEVKDAVADKAVEVKDVVADKAVKVKDAVADKAAEVKDAVTK